METSSGCESSVCPVTFSHDEHHPLVPPPPPVLRPATRNMDGVCRKSLELVNQILLSWIHSGERIRLMDMVNVIVEEEHRRLVEEATQYCGGDEPSESPSEDREARPRSLSKKRSSTCSQCGSGKKREETSQSSSKMKDSPKSSHEDEPERNDDDDESSESSSSN